MAALWADVDDIKSRWLLTEELPADDKLEELIEDAEDTILARFPDMSARVTADIVPQRRVVKIIAELVIERALNPRGTRQVSTTTGPFSDSETFGGTNPGRMVLSETQVRELSGAKSRRAFTVNTIPSGWR